MRTSVRKGREIYWCPTCDRWFYAARDSMGRYTWTCTRCGAPVRQLRCARCGYKWYSNKAEPPQVCTSCKSPYYNRERIDSDPADERKDGRKVMPEVDSKEVNQ